MTNHSKAKLEVHEDFRREESPSTGSDRSFGLVFAAVFAIVGLLPLVKGHPLRVWALGVAAAFLLLALISPAVLGPLNQAWGWVGRVLNRIVSPVVMALLYFLAFTPTGWLMRLSGKRPLDLEFERSKQSYWTVREPSEPVAETMKRQF